MRARVLIGATLLLGGAVMAGWAVTGRTRASSSAVPAASSQARITPASVSYAKSLGSSSAPIRIEVFTDYECPMCATFYLRTLRPVIDNYVSTGKVYLVHRDFPLAMHTYSRDAARWATAAAVAGDFEAVDQALYANQEKWEVNGQIEPFVAAVLSPAEMKKVKSLFTQDASELDAAVETDYALGRSKNVDATPSIFITAHGQTSELPPGGVGYPLMKQYLDYLLQR